MNFKMKNIRRLILYKFIKDIIRNRNDRSNILTTKKLILCQLDVFRDAKKEPKERENIIKKEKDHSYCQRFFNISHLALTYIFPYYILVILLILLANSGFISIWAIFTVLLMSAQWNTMSMNPPSDQWYTRFKWPKKDGYNIF